ncbi:MAG: hypothetical protein NTW98_03270, partial [Candidatus Nomurabacteria bacterium]|nr:hypothetical protein [Candidatus Nomurabacteria bacterium]
VNNFYRLIFVYKNPISDIQIKKEEGVTGVDFKKFSPDYLLNVNNEERVLFDEYIINDEIPAVINFLNSK